VGEVLGSVIGAVGALTVGAVAVAVSALLQAFLAVMVPFAKWRTAANTKESYTGKQKTDGLTHSQIAKDDPDHPLHGAADDLAKFVEIQFGRKMIEVWAGRADVKEAMAMVDTYVARPAKGDWWKATLATFVNRPKKDPPADQGPGG